MIKSIQMKLLINLQTQLRNRDTIKNVFNNNLKHDTLPMVKDHSPPWKHWMGLKRKNMFIT